MRHLALAPIAALLLAGSLPAQNFTTHPCKTENSGSSGIWGLLSGGEQLCELRTITLPSNGHVSVSGRNGGIELLGEDRSDIFLEARIVVHASSRDDADSLFRQIKINTAGTIQAQGPDQSGWFSHGWSVNYRLHVPHRVAANLVTMNGGIELSNVDGQVTAQTTNGGIELHDLAGDVHATTTNGGVDVSLAGDTWSGAGLFARSVNGGISVKAPANYSAHLIAGTVNGGVSVAFPIPADTHNRRSIDTSIGHGGPTLDLHTTNGGVSIDRD